MEETDSPAYVGNREMDWEWLARYAAMDPLGYDPLAGIARHVLELKATSDRHAKGVQLEIDRIYYRLSALESRIANLENRIPEGK